MATASMNSHTLLEIEAGREVEGTCMELALEGERLFDTGKRQQAIKFFEAAVKVGTDNLTILSSIYNQMGNAYFSLQNYSKALEYHRLDLNLSRCMKDKMGEAKASANLGNTLKVLGKFEEAVLCASRHLAIAREVGDRVSEARALYIMGNVYHAQGKHANHVAQLGPMDQISPDVKNAFKLAAKYYEENLVILRELNDRAAQGPTCGNLGNTHSLLGNFSEAVKFHTERLAISKEFGDKNSERRSYSNLGNNYTFLGDYKMAIKQYKNALNIAHQLNQKALEAQACYSIGISYNLMGDHNRAVEYHQRHMKIAQELGDRVGEGRACWSLANDFSALDEKEQALQYASQFLEISEQIGDEASRVTAEHTIAKIKHQSTTGESAAQAFDNAEQTIANQLKINERSGSNDISPSSTSDMVNTESTDTLGNITSADNIQQQPLSEEFNEEDDFFSLISKTQSRRMNEQRCSFKMEEDPNTITPGQDAFLDLVAGVQGRRMNDQRATAPSFPGLMATPEVLGQLMDANNKENRIPDDAFFEILMRCQDTRIDDQRSDLPDPLLFKSPTVPESIYNLVMRLQAPRLNEQRCDPPRDFPAENCPPQGTGMSASRSLNATSGLTGSDRPNVSTSPGGSSTPNTTTQGDSSMPSSASSHALGTNSASFKKRFFKKPFSKKRDDPPSGS